MAGIKIVDLPAVGRDLAATDLFEMSLAGGTGSRKITGQEIMNASKLSVNNTPVVNGTSGRIFFQDATNVLQQSANLFWDNTNARLGIGTSSPATGLNVTNGFNLTVTPLNTMLQNVANNYVSHNRISSSGTFGYDIRTNGNQNSFYRYNTGTGNTEIGSNFYGIEFYGTNAIRAFMTAGGNFLINTTTDAGFKLDVNGPARVVNTLRLDTEIVPSASAYTNGPLLSFVTASGWASGRRPGISFWGQSNSGAYLYYDGSLNFRAINDSGLTMTFASQAYVLANQPWAISGSNISYIAGNVGIGTASPSFTLDVNGTARVQNTLRLGITGIAGEVLLSRSLDGLPTAGVRAINSGVEIGGSGYLDRIRCGNGQGISFFTFSSGSSSVERMYITNGNGNVLINTGTDAGFKLDVNGTARVTGTGNVFTINDSSNSRTFTFNPSYATHLYGGLISHSTSNITLNANIGTDSSFVGIFLGGVAGSRNASARLQIDDTTRGFLPPRMTQTQRNAIASPAIGLEIYQTDATEGKYIYKSSGWTYIG